LPVGPGMIDLGESVFDPHARGNAERTCASYIARSVHWDVAAAIGTGYHYR
jgi:hypothetical protein